MELYMALMIIVGVMVAWILHRFGFLTLLGYIFGGIIIAFLSPYIGLDISKTLSYFEPLRWLGITLLAFDIGASMSFKEIEKSVYRVIACESMLYLFALLSSSIAVYVFSLNPIDKLLIFLIMVNSSTIAIISTRITLPEIYINAALQTSIEDVLQFSLFTLFISIGLSPPDPFKIFTWILRIAGSILIFLAIGNILLKAIGKSRFFVDRETKFFVSIALALIFASASSILGLPPLFGSFIAGALSVIYLSVDDIYEMLRGVRELGMLIYFASIGLQLSMYTVEGGSLDVYLMFTSISLGVIAMAVRFLGLMFGLALSGVSFRESTSIALILTPISEMGIVFADVLYKSGLISGKSFTMATTATIFTIAIYSFISPKINKMVKQIEDFLPNAITKTFNIISTLYIRRVEILISLLKPVVKFMAITLVVTYINTQIREIIKYLNGTPIAIIFIGITSILTILITFSYTVRSIYKVLVASMSKRGLRIIERVGETFDIVIGAIAIATLIYIFYETVTAVLPMPIWTTGTLFIAILILIIIMIYETLKRYRAKIKEANLQNISKST
jgi:Kef-type K+ transport system membrane component KefB